MLKALTLLAIAVCLLVPLGLLALLVYVGGSPALIGMVILVLIFGVIRGLND